MRRVRGWAIGRPLFSVVLALSVVLSLTYARVLVGGKTFATGDHLRFAIPARAQLADALRAGRLPEWWDGVGLGEPVASTPYYQSAYLPAWLVALFGPMLGTDLVVLAHLLVGGVGLAAWVRRLGGSAFASFLGGALFMEGGYMSSMVVMHAATMSPAWIPWAAWSADRVAASADATEWRPLAAAIAVAAVPLSAGFMTGDPSGATSAVLVALLVAATRARRRLRALGAQCSAIPLALAMSSVVLLPAALHVGETDRALGVDPDAALAWSLHPLSLIQLAWPRAFGDPTDITSNIASIVADTSRGTGIGPTWAYSIHCGWVALLLGVTGALTNVRGARLLALGSLVFLVVAMGSYTPVYAWFRAAIVTERWLRYPAKHFAAVAVLWSALAGLGFDRLFRKPKVPWFAATLVTSLSAALILTVFASVRGTDIATSIIEASNAPEARYVQADKVREAFVGGGAATIAELAVFGATVLAVGRESLARWACPLAAATVIVPLGVEASRLVPLVARDDARAIADSIAAVPVEPRAPRPRVLREPVLRTMATDAVEQARLTARTASENLAALHGLASVPGYTPGLKSRGWRRVLEAAPNRTRTMMSLFDVGYAIFSVRFTPKGFDVVSRDDADGIVLLRRLDRRPRAFVASHWTSQDDDDAAIRAMFDPASDLGTIRLAGARETAPPGLEATAPPPCDIQTPWPERVDLLCSSPTGGYAVLLDAWDSGWSATVDGTPTPIEHADVVLRAVAVGPGEHRISYVYRTPGLRSGAAATLIAWLLVLWAMRIPHARPPDAAE